MGEWAYFLWAYCLRTVFVCFDSQCSVTGDYDYAIVWSVLDREIMMCTHGLIVCVAGCTGLEISIVKILR